MTALTQESMNYAEWSKLDAILYDQDKPVQDRIDVALSAMSPELTLNILQRGMQSWEAETR